MGCRCALLVVCLTAIALALPVAAGAASNLPWSEQSPPNSPAPRRGAAATYDPVVGKVLLFGGADGAGTPSDDTWMYNGTNWIPLLTETSPDPRSHAAMAYDPAIGKVVLFGGEEAGGHVQGDTWTYDGHDWTEQVTAHHPPSRGGGSMTYDPATGDIILFGGKSSSNLGLSDTWTYDGHDWIEQSPATAPPGRADASLAYDAAIGKVVLFGGEALRGPLGVDWYDDTWAYDGTEWVRQSSRISPPFRGEASMTYDAAAGKLLLFGGYGEEEEGSFAYEDTWTYDGSGWAPQLPARRPSARSDATLTYDAATGLDVLFGGREEDGDDLADTWTYRVASAPTATVSEPNGGQTFTVGATVPTRFDCEEGAGGPGLVSCTDTSGSTSGLGDLDTSTLGAHTYTVTARSGDGEIGHASIDYTVVAAPSPPPPIATPAAPAAPTCTVPKLGGTGLKGAKKRIRAAGCAVGRLRKRPGATARHGKVIGQSPRPGTTVPAATKVGVTLAPPHS